MNCLECLDLLQRRLDGETLPQVSELDQHLAQCLSCRAMHASALALLKGLPSLPVSVLPPDFSQRLTGFVLADRQVRRRRVRLSLAVTGALAASILVMAVAGYLLLPIPRHPSPPVSQESRQAKPAAVANLGKSMGDARQSFTALSERWADQAKEQTKILLSAAPTLEISAIDNLPEKPDSLELEPAAQSLQQAGQGVADSFHPVAQSAQRAFAYFLRELPVLERKQ